MDKPFAILCLDACFEVDAIYFQVVEISTAQVNEINWSLIFGLIVVSFVWKWNLYMTSQLDVNNKLDYTC